MRKREKMNLFGWFLVAFAVITTTIGLTGNNKIKRQLDRDGVCVEGVVLNSRLSSSFKAISIEYIVNGKSYITTTNKSYKKGVKVQVKYSQSNPQIALIMDDCD